MSANEKRGEVDIEFAGKSMTMRATFDCLCRIEQQSGERLVPLLTRISQGDFGYTDAAIIITEGLRAGSESGGVSLKAVGQEVFDKGLAHYTEAVVKLLHLGVGGPRLEDDNPTKAAKAKK